MRPILPTLSDELVAMIKARSHLKHYAAGEEIFLEGDLADVLPIVVKGSVKMVRSPDIGKEVIIGIFRDGEMFAVPPVYDGEPYPASAYAVNLAEVIELPRDNFLSLIGSSPEFSHAVIGWMCEMIRDKNAIIGTLAMASPERRVGTVIAKLAENGHATPIRIPVRRQDIAEMAGLTTETTIRAVRKLADRGIFRIERGKIIIDDLEPLLGFIRS